MCGRYTLSQAERLEELYAERGLELVPRYNIAPTQVVPVVLDESPGRLSAARWGLIPIWARDKKIASSLINARCETVAVKPAFRTAFKKRRCLIPADGFYEWQKVGAVKTASPWAMGGCSSSPGCGKRGTTRKAARCGPAPSSRPRPMP
jgi:putative SOS response-associated peptidase YedK